MTTVEDQLDRIAVLLDENPVAAVETAHRLAGPVGTLAELARRGRAQSIAAAHDELRMPYHVIGGELGLSKPMIQQMVYLGREDFDPPRRPASRLGVDFDEAARTPDPVVRARRYTAISEAARELQREVTNLRARAVRRAVLLGSTQQELADRLGVTKTLIGQIDQLGRRLDAR
jgi:hypothetical protein